MLREVPDVPCFGSISPALEEEIDEYRRGARPIHVLGGAVVALALGLLSSERRAQAGQPRLPGPATAIALAVYAGYLAAILANREVAEAGYVLGWVSILTGPMAVLLAGVTLFLIRRRARIAAARTAAATAWIVALTLIPGELGLILSIDDPLCLD